MKSTLPRHPLAIVGAIVTTADAVVTIAPTIASGWRGSVLFMTNALFQALHVGDERVEIRRGQRAVLRRHGRLLRGLGLRRGLDRMGDPLLDVVRRQFCADAV